MKKLVLISVAVMGLAFPITAANSSAVIALKNEPLSLFEWGIYRLERRSEHFAWDHLDLQKHLCNVYFDERTEKLLIDCALFPRNRSLQATPADAVCTSAITQIKALFGIGEGEHMSVVRRLQGIGTFFRPRFSKADGLPKDVDRQMEALTELSVSVLVSKNDEPPSDRVSVCRSMLLSSEISFTRKAAP